MVKVFRVPRIKGEGCATTSVEAFEGMSGVGGAKVGIAERKVQVEFDPARVDEARMRRVLQDAGFPPA